MDNQKSVEFNKTYVEFLEKIERKLDEVISATKPKSMKNPFQYLIGNGGKRLRPVLSMISCGAVGEDPNVALELGTSLEILHNFTLVHDDIMDGSPLRRGKPAVHKKFGQATAILVGDIMIGYACKLMPKGNKFQNAEKMQELFMESLIVVCEGQAFDMDFNWRKDISVDNYIDMIGRKTANLIRTSVLMGAYAGSSDLEQIKYLEEFAYSMGIAFQIQDDYLDLNGEESDFGKVRAQDLIEGKKTFMIIRSKELVKDGTGKDLLEQFYKNNGCTKEEIDDMLSLMNGLGVFKEAKELYEQYFFRAEQALKKLKSNYYTEMLFWIMEKTKNRKV